jgi:hypothetical protein
LEVWNTLRELTGLDNPFTQQLQARLEQELGAQHQQELDALKAEHEAELAEVAAGTDREAIGRLSQRLIALAGYPTRTRAEDGNA